MLKTTIDGKPTNVGLDIHVTEVSIRTSRPVTIEQLLFAKGKMNIVKSQVAQDLSMNHRSNTICQRMLRVCMGFSTRYPWR